MNQLLGEDTSMLLVSEDVGQDSVPDGSTIVPEVQTTQTESIKPETVDEIQEESTESETPVGNMTTESSKSVKTALSTESTGEVPESEATPFITTLEWS